MTSRAPTTERAADGGESDQAEQDGVERVRRHRCGACGRPGSKPAASQRWPSSSEASQGRPSRHPGQGDVAAVDQEQAAEEQGLDVGARAEDVAGEDRPRRQATDEDDRNGAVVALVLAPPEQRGTGGEDEGRPEGAERRGEAEAVGENEAGEGRGADRVREEGQPAQDDPGAEQARRDREDQDLDQAALDEGQLEGLEHRSIKSKMRLIFIRRRN